MQTALRGHSDMHLDARQSTRLGQMHENIQTLLQRKHAGVSGGASVLPAVSFATTAAWSVHESFARQIANHWLSTGNVKPAVWEAMFTELATLPAVSYTHLTLPTKRIV